MGKINNLEILRKQDVHLSCVEARYLHLADFILAYRNFIGTKFLAQIYADQYEAHSSCTLKRAHINSSV